MRRGFTAATPCGTWNPVRRVRVDPTGSRAYNGGMKRSSLFFTSVLTGVLGVATLGCAPKAVAPMKLIPEGAVALAGVDLSALMATPMFKNNEQDQDTQAGC